MKAKLCLIALVAVFSFTSCEDDEDDQPAPIVNTDPTPMPDPAPNPIVFDNYAGSLIAVQSESSTIAGTINIGTAVGAFVDANGNSISVGDITCEGQQLSMAGNNAYTFTPGLLSPTGIAFSGAVNWEITGGNGIPATSFENTDGFPTVGAISSGATVDKSEGYTLTTPSISNADSVIFMVGNVIKVRAGSTTSYTFTPSELSQLQNGTSVASIAPYNFRTAFATTYGNVYAVNEKVVQITVNIQD